MWIGVALGVGVAVWGYRCGGNYLIGEILKDNRSEIYGTLASIFGSLFGFTITATSIVLGLSGNVRLAVVRGSPHYSELWETLFSAIRWLGLATILALIGLIFDREASPFFLGFYAVVFATILVSFRLARCVWVLERAIKIVTDRSKARPGGRQSVEASSSETERDRDV